MSIPAWAGRTSLNCLTSSIRFAISNVADCGDGLFGGFLALEGYSKCYSIAECASDYLTSVYGDVYAASWERVQIGSCRELMGFLNSTPNSIYVLDVQATAFQSYPDWRGSNVVGESHCLVALSESNGSLTLIDPSLLHGDSLFSRRVTRLDDLSFTYPLVLNVFAADRFVQLTKAISATEVNDRKLEAARSAVRAARSSLGLLLSEEPISLDDPTLPENTHPVFLYRAHQLAQSDSMFWLRYDTEKLRRASARCQQRSETVLAKLLLRAVSKKRGSGKTYLLALSVAAKQMNQSLSLFYDLIDKEIGRA